MEDNEPKTWKIYYTTAISTAFLAFLAFTGLIFTIFKFIESKSFGYRTAFSILIFILLGLFFIIKGFKRWLNK